MSTRLAPALTLLAFAVPATCLAQDRTVADYVAAIEGPQ